MIEGRRGQLDLTAFRQLAVQRQDLPKQIEMLVQNPVLLLLGEMAALAPQLPQLAVVLEGERMNPREVEPHLQVPQIALIETAEGLFGGIPAKSTTLIKFKIAREGPDHMIDVGHKKVIKQEQRMLPA